MLPETFLKAKWNGVSKIVRIAFLTALISGSIIHLKLFAGNYANEDFLSHIQYSANHIRSGRWSERLLISFRSNYSLSIVIGVIAILLLALTVAMTVYVLKIEKNIYACIVALLMVSFPTLVYSYGYFMMVHTYSIALFLATLAVVCTLKWKYGWIIGAICLGFSMGCYQSYVAYAMTLCASSLIVCLLNENPSFTRIRNMIIKYLFMGVGGVFVYFIGLKVMLQIYDTSLLSYKGIDTMGQIPLEQIPYLLLRTYVHFLEFFLGKYFFAANLFQRILYISWLIVSFFAVILIWVTQYKKRSIQWWHIIFSIAVAGCFPLCVNIVDFISPLGGTDALSIYSMVLVFVLPIALVDKYDKGKAFLVEKWGVSIIALLIFFSFFVVTNIYYLKLETYTQYSLMLNNRIFSRIEQMEGFSTDKKVAIISNQSVPVYFSERNDFPDIQYDRGLRKQFIGFCEPEGKEAYASTKICALIKNMLGVTMRPASQDQIDTIMDSEEYSEMGVWPSEDSVRIIDDIIVVNFL